MEVKGLKQGYIFKDRPFYVSFSFVIFNFHAGLNIPRKKVFQKYSILLTYPNFFQGVTWTTYFFYLAQVSSENLANY